MAYNRWLAHHGVKGQKWGVQNGPPYPLDSSKSDGHKLLSGDGSPQGKKKYKTSEKTAHKRATRKTKTVFVSGSSKTQDEASEYYRKELPSKVAKALDDHMKRGDKIIVGDAPGIDRQVQDYLNAKNYKNVEIYGPGKQVRYSANSKWKTNPIDDPDHEPGSKEWLAKKDKAMSDAADTGLAVILDDGARATRQNVKRMYDVGKEVKVYSLSKKGAESDKWSTAHDVDTAFQRERYKEVPNNIPDKIRKFLYVKPNGEFTKLGIKKYRMGIGDGSITINDLELRERDRIAYEERLLRDFDFSGLDKKQKARKEYRMLTITDRWNKEDYSQREEEASLILLDKVRRVSMDYFNGSPKTEEQRRYLRNYYAVCTECNTELRKIDKAFAATFRKQRKAWNDYQNGKMDLDTYWSQYEEPIREQYRSARAPYIAKHDEAFEKYSRLASTAALSDIGFETTEKNIKAMMKEFRWSKKILY